MASFLPYQAIWADPTGQNRTNHEPPLSRPAADNRNTRRNQQTASASVPVHCDPWPMGGGLVVLGFGIVCAGHARRGYGLVIDSFRCGCSRDFHHCWALGLSSLDCHWPLADIRETLGYWDIGHGLGAGLGPGPGKPGL